MKYKRLALFAVLSMILLAFAISAAEINSSNYKQSVIISDGGLTNTSSANYIQSITIGGITGQINSSNYKNLLGFFYTMEAEDNVVPIVNAVLNKSLTNIHINDIINITANVTDDVELSYCQIIINQSGPTALEYINISLSGTSGQCSNVSKVTLPIGSVINYTIRVNDSSDNWKTNDTIITVVNSVPTVSSVVLNSSSGTNTTNENLTGYITSSDADNHNITLVYNWYKNGTLNATSAFINDANLISYWPFNNDTYDYKAGNDGTFYGGATINKTNYQVGGGSVEFDGLDDYINLSNDASLNPNSSITLAAWVKSNANGYVIVKDPPACSGTSAFESPVTAVASTEHSATYTAIKARDGLLNTYWFSVYNGIPGWIYFDLGSVKCMSAINISVYHLDSPETMDISVSDDASSWTNVLTGVQETSEAGWDEITFTETSGRYLRLDITAAQRNTYSMVTELQVKTREEGKSDVPYSLSTFNGGEFLIKNNSKGYTANGSSSINDGNWHHLSATYNGSIMKIYIDGTLRGTNTSFSGNLPTNNDSVFIGKHYDSSNPSDYFNGTIDEVMIFNRDLTASEIKQLYDGSRHGGDVLDYNLTSIGDNWTLGAIPVDYLDIGAEVNSSQLEIISGLPSKVSLSSPTNNSVITNRTPRFNWTVATGITPITYELLIQRESCQDLESCVTDLINVTGIEDTNYTITDLLDVDAVYNWTVRANNSAGYGEYADTFNFTINSLISLTLPTSSVDFGTLALGSNENTTDDSPAPIKVENDGNVLINISLYANESLWVSKSLNTSFFRFKIDNSTEEGSFNSAPSITDWFNITSYAVGAIKQLNFSDATDLAEIELYVSVPTDEIAGTKTSTLVIEGEAS